MSAEYDEMQAKIEAEKQEKQKATLGYIGQANRVVLLKEYAERGLDPVYADEERQVVVSLPMMLHVGWRVDTIAGRKTLTRS